MNFIQKHGTSANQVAMKNACKYQIIHSNGQRIYCPLSATTMTKPPRGTEVFVGNLPRDLFEDELIPLFSKIGPIYQLRLMMDFSGNTRGFAFVCYYTVEHADNAILKFNNYAIRKEAVITVHLSLDNCRLFFGNVPKDKSKNEIKEELTKYIDGIVDVIIYQDSLNPRCNRGFAFVEFENHAMAAIARRKMLAGFVSLWGRHQKAFVDWAEPEPIVHPMILMQITILYLKNVPVEYSLSKFKHLIFELVGYIGDITRTYKKDNYAFIHFRTREAAEEALVKLKREVIIIHGQEMQVEWARPISYSKKFRWNQVPDNFCLSVPPKTRKLILKSKQKPNSVVSNGSTSASSDGYPETESPNLDLLCSHINHLSFF